MFDGEPLVAGTVEGIQKFVEDKLIDKDGGETIEWTVDSDHRISSVLFSDDEPVNDDDDDDEPEYYIQLVDLV